MTCLNRLHILALLCLLCGYLHGQPPVNWDLTFGGEAYEEMNGLLVEPDGIIMAGSSKSNMTFGNPNDYTWNILIAKVDFNGVPIWTRYYGGNADDRLWNIIKTSDGGFLAGGFSYSGAGGDKTEPSRGDKDVWVLKLDAQGNKIWDKTFGSLYQEELFAMQEIPDGSGYLLGCHSISDAGGDKTENGRGGQDFWLISTDLQGNKRWDKTIGGNNYDQIHDIEWASDGMLYLSGGTASDPASGELGADAAHGSLDFLLIKFNPFTRQVIWTRRYGGSGGEFAYALTVAPDGKIWMGGGSNSEPAAGLNSKKAPFYGGNSDFWLIELNENGMLLNDYAFGGTGLDDLYWIDVNAMGQIVLGGVTDSGISGNKSSAPKGGYDYWLVGLDRYMRKTWDLTLGGSDHDALTRIARLPTGELLFGGHSQSNMSSDKSQNSLGVNDFWLLSTLCARTAEIVQDIPPACVPEDATLDAGVQGCDICLYEWKTGDTTALLNVPPGAQGKFPVLVYDHYGCFDRDTVSLSTPSVPTVDIGPPDTLIQNSETLTLSDYQPGLTYEWNTGQTSSSILVLEDGLYAVTVTNGEGCTASDQILVTFEKEGKIYVPNAFLPDWDGRNEYVTVYGDRSVLKVNYFRVYDRWGGLCFERRDFEPNVDHLGWDGRWRGKPLPAGVYVWTLSVAVKDSPDKILTGNVLLVR